MLRSGVVSLAGLHPFEMLVSLPPFAGWTAKACEHCFYGGVSNEVLALENYVANELSFLTPIGALYVHGPFSEVRRLLAKCDAASALFCSRDLLFNLAKCVEIAGEGHSGEWDTVVYKTLALCHPYRTRESAPRSALALLLQYIGTFSEAEARRQVQRTPGLTPAHRPAHMRGRQAPAPSYRENASVHTGHLTFGVVTSQPLLTLGSAPTSVVLAPSTVLTLASHMVSAGPSMESPTPAVFEPFTGETTRADGWKPHTPASTGAAHGGGGRLCAPTSRLSGPYLRCPRPRSRMGGSRLLAPAGNVMAKATARRSSLPSPQPGQRQLCT